MYKAILASITFVILLVTSCFSQSDTAHTTEISEIKAELQRLHLEVDSLRSELRTLQIKNTPATRLSNSEESKVEYNHADTIKSRYWLSKSGKRHNTTCRYFGSKGGRTCGAGEGVACKKCGG